jgi:hypothetical protein
VLEAQGFIIERRFYKKYVVDGVTFNVSAKIDAFDLIEGRLSDYKYTSVASAGHGLKEDYRLQVNFQAMLVNEAGFVVQLAEVVPLLKDWSPMRVFGSYPEHPTVTHVVPLMPKDEVDTFIIERIRLHEAAKQNLPLCSPSERFNRPTFAVMKDVKAIKAERVFDTRDEAEAYITAKEPNLPHTRVLVERPGVDTNCKFYCPVRFVCEQAKAALPAPILDEDGFIKIS